MKSLIILTSNNFNTPESKNRIYILYLTFIIQLSFDETNFLEIIAMNKKIIQIGINNSVVLVDKDILIVWSMLITNFVKTVDKNLSSIFWKMFEITKRNEKMKKIEIFGSFKSFKFIWLFHIHKLIRQAFSKSFFTIKLNNFLIKFQFPSMYKFSDH